MTVTLFVLLGFLGGVLYKDSVSESYDGTIPILALCSLIAGILGFELVVNLIRRGRDDL